MKVLNLGLDNSILDKASPLAQRAQEYGDLVELYTIIVPAREDREVQLSNRVRAFGVRAGNKIVGLVRMHKAANKILAQEKYNIITVQDQYYLALLGYWLACKFKLGLEIQNHGWEKYSGLRKAVAKFVLPRAHAVRTVSQRLKKQLTQEFGVREERITVVPVHVEIPESSATESRVRQRLQDDKFIFFTVVRLVPVKNISLKIRAMARVVKNNPNIELWIVGEGSEKENLELEIRSLGLENNIKLFGWVDHDRVKEMYYQADVFLLTSNAEGWPQVIVEAAARALPIIMTDVGSAGELIINKKTGLVIPVNDLDALVAAMEELINNPGLREQLGKNARQAARSLPAKQDILNLYRKSWERVVRERE